MCYRLVLSQTCQIKQYLTIRENQSNGLKVAQKGEPDKWDESRPKSNKEILHG